MHPKVDEFINKAKKWQPEMEQLRIIAIDSGLTEDFKWRQPCYTFNDKNVAIIGNFKDYCVLSFFKGALLKDKDKILAAPGENSQAVRMFRFTNVERIIKIAPQIKDYIHEAIEIEKSGQKIEFKKSEELEITEELQKKFNELPDLKKAFESLTPGRQRAYVLYFSQAKQSQTRISRIEKYIPQILGGFGINDCTCGLSKKMPTCDGSHKNIK